MTWLLLLVDLVVEQAHPEDAAGIDVPGVLPDVPDQPVVAVLLLFVLVLTFMLARFYAAIMRGDLVPSKERDHWRDAFFAQQSTTQELLVTAEISRGVFRAMDPAASRAAVSSPPVGDPDRPGGEGAPGAGT